MTVAISCGEKSGDVLAGLLESELGRTAPACRVVRLQSPTRFGPVMGFAAGLAQAGRLGRAVSEAEAEMVALRPDVLVLISYAGFNLPLGRRCRRLGVPVLYLSPPQVWAWGRWRVSALRAAADQVVCLFRFEEAFLRARGVDARCFGYPLLGSVRTSLSREQVLTRLGFEPEQRYVAYLPGSRPGEIAHHRPLFGAVHQRLASVVPGLGGAVIAEPSGDEPPGMVAVTQERYDIIGHAAAAMVVSGTATAECAILGVPMIVSYHLSPMSLLVTRGLVRIPFFSLPNILAGQRVVPEFLNPSAQDLARALAEVVCDQTVRTAMRRELAGVTDRLGPAGAMASIGQMVCAMACTRSS